MKILISVLAALTLSACSSSATKKSSMTLSTSSSDVRVTCRMDWSECERKAREYCGGDYREVRDPGATGGVGSGTRSGGIYRPATPPGSMRSMTIRCK